jgi:hypothetical protein
VTGSLSSLVTAATEAAGKNLEDDVEVRSFPFDA